MKCPKCGSGQCKYEDGWKERLNKVSKGERKKEGMHWRKNFKANCKCGWSGIA